MVRSKWKGPFVDESIVRKIRKSPNKIKTWSRRSVIMPLFVGHTVNVYNGKIFIPVTVTEEMIGHKFGEFSVTKRQVKHVVKTKKK